MNTNIRLNTTKDILLELLSIAFLATGGIFVKFSTLPPINTGFYRALFSLPFLFPLAYKHLKKLSKKDIFILLFAGIFLAGDVSLMNLSFHYTTVANANLLANLTPFTVIPVTYFLFKEKIPRFFFVGALITLLGSFILIGGKINPNPDNYLGDLLAFCTSFFYSCFLLISYKLRDKIESSVIMFVSGFGTTFALFLSSCAIEGFKTPKSVDELWPLLGLTLCMQVIGHNLLAHCQGKINVNLSSIICLCQPAIASLYSFFLFQEILSYRELSGILIVIIGGYFAKLQYSKPPKTQLQESN